jgi:hypothetical protein
VTPLWTYAAEDSETWEAWMLKDASGERKGDANGALLYIVNYDNDDEWSVVHPKDYRSTRLGVLPYDTPIEELHALAIAMWRLG